MLPAATATHLIIRDQRQFTRQQIFNHWPDVDPFAIVVDIDADLAKPHEWAHSDAADDQGVDLMEGQQVDRHHTAALNVFLILDGAHRFDLTVFGIDAGKDVTVTEMAGPLAV
jgi:hypothetical protein